MTCFVCGRNNDIYGKLKFLSIDEIQPIKLDLFICECNFAFYRHGDINKLYKQNSKYTTNNTGSGASKKFDTKRLQNSFKNISKHFKSTDNILDVGCNNGTFLEILYENGLKNLSGTDFAINREYTQKLEDLGVNIYEAMSLNEIGFNKEFDFITANHVLEHVDNIEKFIKELHSNLKNNGKLYVEVPDASRYNELYFQPFSYFDLEHINHFSFDNLSYCLSKYGFEILASFSFNIDMNDLVQYPGLGILAEKSNSYNNVSLNTKSEAANNIDAFYKRSLSEISNFNYRGSFDNIVIYGVGANTLRTLAMLDKDINNIKYFVDKNELFHNRFILNKEIKGIDYLLNDATKPDILIFSKLYFNEIFDDLRKRGITNNIHSFF